MLSAPAQEGKVSVWPLAHKGPGALAKNPRQPWCPVSGKHSRAQGSLQLGANKGRGGATGWPDAGLI